MSQKESINIMIIDDDKDNLQNLRVIIETKFKNVNVIEANSGLVALCLILKQKVDLIFVNTQMYQMDGFETAKMIQKRKKTQHVPIVFLTTTFRPKLFQKKGFDPGAVDYLTKPIDSLELNQKIQTYLRLIQQQQEEKIEQNIPESVAGIVFESHHLLKQEIVFERKQIEHLKHELQRLLKAVINRHKIVEIENRRLGQNGSIADIETITSDLQYLLDLVDEVLGSKLKSGRKNLVI